MYHGEVNVAQEDLNSFLAVAEELRIKGLTQGQQKADAVQDKPKQTSYKPSSPRPATAESAAPALKKFKPSIPLPQPVDDDEIQEVQPAPVVSVKTEAPELHQPSQPRKYYQAEQVQQENQIETYQGEDFATEEGYEDYSEQYSMDSSLNDSNIVQMDSNGKGM